jgi:hypothetical protein
VLSWVERERTRTVRVGVLVRHGSGKRMVEGAMGLTADRKEDDGENAEEEVSAGCAHFGGCVVLNGFSDNMTKRRKETSPIRQFYCGAFDLVLYIEAVRLVTSHSVHQEAALGSITTM